MLDLAASLVPGNGAFDEEVVNDTSVVQTLARGLRRWCAPLARPPGLPFHKCAHQ